MLENKERKTTKFYSLEGKVFGSLIVLHEVGRGRRGVIWECICRCARHRNVTSEDLRRRRVKACLHCSLRERLNGLKKGKETQTGLKERWYDQEFRLNWLVELEQFTDAQMVLFEIYVNNREHWFFAFQSVDIVSREEDVIGEILYFAQSSANKGRVRSAINRIKSETSIWHRIVQGKMYWQQNNVDR
jgi:hypothetical protein